MSDVERGEIRTPEYALQVRDFTGLRYGKITPTDIDGFIDFDNKLFIFLEPKYKGKGVDRGQELALERLCDACRKAGVRSVVIVADHEASPPAPIPCAACVVRVIYDGTWRPPNFPITVRKAIDYLLTLPPLASEWEPPCFPSIPAPTPPRTSRSLCERSRPERSGWGFALR